MNIHRQDYEHWFLLYVDDELTPAERAEVEAFVAVNPDLAEELQLLLSSRLHPEPLSFPGKAALLRQPQPDAADEEQLLLLLDRELPPAATAALESRIRQEPVLSEAWTLLQQTRLQPEPHLVCPDKASLYRRSNNRVVPLRRWQLAAAAMLIGAGLWGTVQYLNPTPGAQPETAGVQRKTGNREQGMKNIEQGTQNNEQGMKQDAERMEKEGTNAGDGLVLNQPVAPSASRHAGGIKEQQGLMKEKEGIKNTVKGLKEDEQPMENTVAVQSNPQPAAEVDPGFRQPAQLNDAGMKPEEAATGNVVAANMPSTANEPRPTASPSSAGSETVYASFDEDNDDRPRKTKLGAFFRQAKRVFERKTKIKTGNNEDVRIANMTFAMH